MNYDDLLYFCKTDAERILIEAIIEHGSVTKACEQVGTNTRNSYRRLKGIKTRAASAKGVSSYEDGNGNVQHQWVKRDFDRTKQIELMRETVEAFKDEIKPAKRIKSPKKSNQDIINLYPITDYHIGMLSWPDETGEDWNSELAEDMLKRWFQKAIEMAPDSDECVFAQLGDFLHWDGLEAVTPESKHVLDSDTRHRNVVRIALRLVRYIIELLLKKHRKVYVIMADANHDPASEIWLSEAFAMHYEKEPRVFIDTNADTYYCHEFHNVSLFFHHGHKRKPSNIDDVFVAKYRDVFGRTKHSYAHMGHMHHLEAKETNLMIVEQHRTLAAKDAYASRGGWMAGRDAKVITYHKDYGEVGRITISPEML